MIKTKRIKELETQLLQMGINGMAYSEPWNIKAEELEKLKQ